jgi:hypothetical protein
MTDLDEHWLSEPPPDDQLDDGTGPRDLDTAELAEIDRQQKFQTAVSKELRRLRVRHEAQRRHDGERRAQSLLPAFDAGTLEEMMARPPEPPFRVQDLMPSGGSTLVPAFRKTGKTTFLLNLARALLTGGDFLGRFGVRPIDGTLAVLNLELSGRTIAQWAGEVGVPANRLFIVNLRGRRNPFAHDEDRAELAMLLRKRNVETLIVDPFGRAYTGKSQNDPGEVGAWLADLDRFARGDVGATDLVLSTHTGWEGERSRGSTALEDWPDSVITLVNGREHARYMHAFGRDVDVEEDRLEYDPATRRLTLAGSGSRKAATKAHLVEELIPLCVGIVEDHPGVNGSVVEKKLREDRVVFQRGDERKALAAAVERGLLDMQRDKGTAKNYRPPGRLPKLPQPLPTGRPQSLPNPSLLRGEGLTGDQPPEPPQRSPTTGRGSPSPRPRCQRRAARASGRAQPT